MEDSPASNITTTHTQQARQQHLLHKLDLFQLQGRDKHGRRLLRIIPKFFPARYVSGEALKKYLEDRVLPQLAETSFAVVYVNTGVRRSENWPGISALRSVYDAIPADVRRNLEAVYFLHPGLQSRLFLATIGRLLFPGGLYEKIKYVKRVEFLWKDVRRKEVEVPEFVYREDEELDRRPMWVVDFGLESDHPRLPCRYGAPPFVVDSAAVPSYSMRCIA